MRIESSTSHSNNALLKSRKNKKKSSQDENQSLPDSEFLELSDESRLLHKLLYATSNQFIPYPFYFSNAAARNVKQACKISRNIQSQAESMGILLNYTMIYDLVIHLANQVYLGNIQWEATFTPEHESLNNTEKMLFEALHNACAKNKIPVDNIESIALNYVQLKQNRAQNLPTKQECAAFIVSQLKMSPDFQKAQIVKELSQLLKQFSTDTVQKTTQ